MLGIASCGSVHQCQDHGTSRKNRTARGLGEKHGCDTTNKKPISRCDLAETTPESIAYPFRFRLIARSSAHYQQRCTRDCAPLCFRVVLRETSESMYVQTRRARLTISLTEPDAGFSIWAGAALGASSGYRFPNSSVAVSTWYRNSETLRPQSSASARICSRVTAMQRVYRRVYNAGSLPSTCNLNVLLTTLT